MKKLQCNLILLLICLWVNCVSAGEPYVNNSEAYVNNSEASAKNQTAYLWHGFYAGINAGYGHNSGNVRGSTTLSDSEYLTANNKDEEHSFIGGVQVGANHQYGNIMLGVEADFNDSQVEDSEYLRYDWGFAKNYYHHDSKVDWFSTLRGRIGYTPRQNILLFVTGGVAMGRIESKARFEVDYTTSNQLDTSWSSSARDTRFGGVVGAGAEYSVASKWSVKAEYLFVDLGTKANANPGQYVNGDAMTYSVKNKGQFSVFRLGVNYKF